MIKNFSDFINESTTDAHIDKALDATILACLSSLSVSGGNSNPDDDWNKVDPMFSDSEPPDTYINASWNPSDLFFDDVEFISTLFYGKDKYGDTGKMIRDRFLKYGMAIESLNTDETVVHISMDSKAYLNYFDDDTRNSAKLEEFKIDVKNFYKHKDKWENELKEKLKTYLKGKKYGI